MLFVNKLPVFDLHCDLLSYLHEIPGANPAGINDIGASLFYLENGGVKLQVMAIYTDVRPGSTKNAAAQGELFNGLLRDYAGTLMHVKDNSSLEVAVQGEKTGIVAAVENASGFCEEDEPLESGFEKLEELIRQTGKLLYISMTHHTENRFGGGNYSEAGLKPDGEALLDYLHGRNIAIDLSHASDKLAEGIFRYIDKQKLKIQVLASHSNFRSVFDHKRNLPNELVREIVRRKGLIGMNFLRAFLNPEKPTALSDHILYGLKRGATDSLCFGADYYYTKDHPDKSRIPFYFREHENATRYKSILARLQADGMSDEQLVKLSYENAYNFISRLWKQ